MCSSEVHESQDIFVETEAVTVANGSSGRERAQTYAETKADGLKQKQGRAYEAVVCALGKYIY